MPIGATQSTRRSGGGGGGRLRRGNNPGPGKGKIEKKHFSKRDMKFRPLGVKGSGHFGTFDEVKENICHKLAKKKLDNPRDIIDSVIDMQMLDIADLEPARTFSAAQDPQDRADESEHLASAWSSNHKEWKYCKRESTESSCNNH